MKIEEAAMILGIQDISNINKDKLKDTYRKLMRIHHPDNRGDGDKAKIISEAYRVVRSFDGMLNIVRNNSYDSSITYILILSELVDLFNGREIIKNTGGRVVNLTRDNLIKYNIIVVIDVDIIVNGVKHNYNIMRKVDKFSDYNIECEIPVDNMDDNLSIVVCVLDKKITTEMKLPTKRVKVGFGDAVDIDIKIKKVMAVGD